MGEWDAHFLGSRERATDTRTFSFERPPELAYEPGQFFFVLLRGQPAGKDPADVEHHFSFSSSPTEPVVEFTTRMTGHEFKNRIAALVEGDTVHIAGPDGAFVLQPGMTKVVHICGGIGITPARSTVKWALDTSADLDIVVLHGNRDSAGTPFRDEFEAMRSERIRWVNVLADPEDGWAGHTGTIDERLVRTEVPDWAERDFYVSGPAGMVDAVTTMLMGPLGVQQRRVFSEHFPGYAAGGG